MSKFEPILLQSDFDRWLTQEFGESRAFTALVVLVRIEPMRVTPLRSTFFNVIGAEVAWSDLVVLFAQAGRDWDGAAFFPVSGPSGGPLDNPAARARLREIEARLRDDRLVLNEGRFFDKWGRSLMVEEEAPPSGCGMTQEERRN